MVLEKKSPTASRQVGLAGSFRRRSGYCFGGFSGVGWGGGSSKGNPFVSASAFRFIQFMVSSIPSARPLASASVSMGRTRRSYSLGRAWRISS